jgi:hypothetical protein
MHALNVSDGLAKVLTALGSGSLTTVMGRNDIDLTTAARQQSTVKWLHADATLKALLPKESVSKDRYDTAFERIGQLVLRACEIRQATVLNQVVRLVDSSIIKPLTLVVEKANPDLTAISVFSK